MQIKTLCLWRANAGAGFSLPSQSDDSGLVRAVRGACTTAFASARRRLHEPGAQEPGTIAFSRSNTSMSRKNPKVGFVSLGCPKALVDSERILTQLRVEGYDIVPSYGAADVVVVNTCGFIDAAVQESLDAIGEALAENGKVIVTGCLGKRADLIRAAHPDVLAIAGPQDYASVMSAVHTQLPPKHDPFVDIVPRGRNRSGGADNGIGIKL